MAALWDRLLAMTDWLRAPLTPTASRWEAISVVALGVAWLVVTSWLVALAWDYLSVRHRRENGGNQMTARAMARSALVRSASVGVLFACFVGLATNWPGTVVLLAFGIPLYAVLKGVDGTLDWLARRQLRRYFRLQERRQARLQHEAAGSPATQAAEWNPHRVPERGERP